MKNEWQISSGQGPAECELGVAKLARSLIREFKGLKLLDAQSGSRNDCYRSARVGSDDPLSLPDGSVKWICQSPFRPNHKRKNWFIHISKCGDAEEDEFDEDQVRFETFRSGGNGGQHVNKTESGVRAIHIPTGSVAISTDERSQYMNKRTAVERLKRAIGRRNEEAANGVKSQDWREHTKIVRGNPTRVYVGTEFKLLQDTKKG
jgi:peptide chain release factor